jgi:hypothetical protein
LAQVRGRHALLAKTGYYTDRQAAPWQTSTPWHRRVLASARSVQRARGFDDPAAADRRPASRLAASWLCTGHVRQRLDPWVLRGEDVDYIISARMHGGGVYLDNEWSIVHIPPDTVSESHSLSPGCVPLRLRAAQDRVREVPSRLAAGHAKSMMPYPAPSLTRR